MESQFSVRGKEHAIGGVKHIVLLWMSVCGYQQVCCRVVIFVETYFKEINFEIRKLGRQSNARLNTDIVIDL